VAMSIRGYANARCAPPKSVRRAVQKRLIVLDAEGRIDPVQTDATWDACAVSGLHRGDGACPSPTAARAAS
jgi:hypothetical protein